MGETGASTGRNDRISVCAGRYEILPDAALPQFSQPAAQAYAVHATRGTGGLIALVTRHGELPRHELVPNAANVNTPNAVRFLESDVVYWPPARRHRPVFVYEKPAGPKLMAVLTEERAPLNNEIGFRQMVESLFEGVRDMYLAGCNHGSINPTNLYMRDSGGTQAQLGDFLSGQPGVNQHPAFETIERMMAQPAGRGPATSADDVYAMGVTLLTLLFGRLPVAAVAPEDLLHAKLEKGSLMALLSGMRLSSAYSELMRGLINDDPRQRWTFDDIGHWLAGRRLGSKPAGQLRKAQRSLDFNGVPYVNARLLAHAMTQKPDLAVKIIEDSSLDRWIRRSLGDEEKADAVADAVATASAVPRGGTLQERIVGRVAQALDPVAPIRFRDAFALPTGVGPLLAHALMTGRSPGNVAELIAAQFINHWVNLPGNFCSENTSVMQIYDGQRMLMDRTQVGFGIERVAYELNPGMPCLSPLLEEAYPLNLRAVLVALEATASRIEPDERREPIDRHIAAFILSRYRRMNDRVFPLLAPTSDPGQRAVAILNIYADLQRKFNPEDMPHLAAWLARLLAPSMDRFHNRALRERILRDVHRLAKRGDLDAMLQLVDDGNMLTQDVEGFDAARAQYLALERAIRDLGTGGTREKMLLTQGRQITAFLSCFLAFVVAGLMLFWQMV